MDVNTRKKLEANQDGEICLKGPILMKGYVNNEGASRDMIDEEGYLKTGDIGYYDADGCFYIVDRLKELIKYNGHQVMSAIEQAFHLGPCITKTYIFECTYIPIVKKYL